jgi:hypothetical protein
MCLGLLKTSVYRSEILSFKKLRCFRITNKWYVFWGWEHFEQSLHLVCYYELFYSSSICLNYFIHRAYASKLSVFILCTIMNFHILVYFYNFLSPLSLPFNFYINIYIYIYNKKTCSSSSSSSVFTKSKLHNNRHWMTSSLQQAHFKPGLRPRSAASVVRNHLWLLLLW